MLFMNVHVLKLFLNFFEMFPSKAFFEYLLCPTCFLWKVFRLFSGRFYRSASNVTTENQDNGAKEDGAIDIRNVDGPPADATPTSVSSSDSHDENASREKRHILYPTWGRRFYWRNRLRLSPWWSSWWDTWNGWYDVDVWNRYSWASLDWWDDFYLYGGK